MRTGIVVALCVLALAGCAGERAAQGTLDDPVPPGQPAEVGGYRISVLGVVPDARDAVLRENALNEPPAPGRAYPLVRLRVTRVGEGGGLLVYDLTFAMVAPDGTVYDRATASCGYVPDDPSYVGNLEPGDSAEMNVCRAVEPGQLTDLRVWLRPFLEPENPGVYFALPEPT